jgi:hypothetical protein
MRKFLIASLLILAACGQAGSLPLAQSPDTNQVSYWCSLGVKYEPVSDPFVVPAPPGGYVWTLLVIKGGSGEGQNVTFPNPVVGQGYSHPTAGNSHVILCKALIPDVTTTTSTTTTSTTLPPTPNTFAVPPGSTTTTSTFPPESPPLTPPGAATTTTTTPLPPAVRVTTATTTPAPVPLPATE